MPVAAAAFEVREELVPRFQRLEEKGLPVADDVRHRQLGRNRKAAPFRQDRPLVPALGEQLDPLPVLADDANRTGARLGGAQPFGQDRVEKLLIQLDELGQWIASGNANERIMQIQALVETAAQAGDGRIWIAVTAHGDVQDLKQNVQQEQYAKINQRFALQCKLSNDDISKVVEERLLRKTQAARI